MKKLFVLLLAFALIACTFAACGGEEADPTVAPTEATTAAPTEAPTAAPTAAPTVAPTVAETEAPSETVAETEAPSETVAETEATEAETVAPTEAETVAPTEAETAAPTEAETVAPTDEETVAQTTAPTTPSVTPPPAGGGAEDYENPILFHTPVLDGILDDEYLKSYKFDNPQYSQFYVFDEEGNGIFDAWTNRSSTYALWDGEYVYIAVELFDDDMIRRSKEYTQWADSEGDVNPYYNDCAEVWFCFELMEPTSITDVRKICYDAFGVGDGPFSAVSEGIYSEHFLASSAAAKAELGYAPDDEQGYKDRAVIEFKIPAKMESGDNLLEGDYICYSIQINDIWPATEEDLIAGGLNPEDFVPVEEEGIRSGFKHSYTRARTHFPEGGELNGYAKGTLTMITPAEVE